MGSDQVRSPLSIQMCEGLMFAAIAAHSQYPRTPELAFRRFDGRTPVALHAVQCATTLVQDAGLPEELRDLGFQTLLFHDLKKDTTADFPVSLPEAARHLVDEMTFPSLKDEMVQIWTRSPLSRLFMLYAKAGNLWDDGSWMPAEERDMYLDYVLKLANLVEEEQGAIGKRLRIIPVIRRLCDFRPV